MLFILNHNHSEIFFVTFCIPIVHRIGVLPHQTMGIVLDRELNYEVLTELQQCKLYPHDTSKVKKMFSGYRRQRMQSNERFGYRINAKQLSDWMGCDHQHAVKVIQRWSEIIGIKQHGAKSVLNKIPSISPVNRRANLLNTADSVTFDVGDKDYTDDQQINMLTLFNVLALLSVGSVADKLRLVIHIGASNRHDSISRKDLDTIIHHTILGVSMLLDITHHRERMERSAKRR